MKTNQFLASELKNIHSQIKKTLNSSLELSFSEIDLLDLINHVNCEEIFYFKSKYNAFTLLGLGRSKTIKAQKLNDYILNHPHVFLTAALLFEESPDKAEYYLPEWTFINSPKRKDESEIETKLFINKNEIDQTFSLPNVFFHQDFDLYLYDPFIPPWTSFEELPEHDQWEKMIAQCDELFSSQTLNKIALSRKKIFQYEEPISPIAFFNQVMKKNNNAIDTYSFFHQETFDRAFISMSPEKLFSINECTFETIALAASAPRGKNEFEDQEFEKLLKNSDKLIREQQIVIDEIIKRIEPVASHIQVSELQTMKLPYIQHRATPISATVLKNTDPINFIQQLHPTPAVGGFPRIESEKQIQKIEPYSRGYYAAPFGVLNAHYSELAVGIRCAFIEGNLLTIIGGAGIVEGSIAEEEWIETGTKMNPYLRVINNE